MTSHVTAGAAGQSSAPPELGLAGSVIKSRYRVNAVASASREVVVYSAEDTHHGRSIALKVLRDEFARDAEFVAAVRNQARALAAAAHALRGVQRVYEYGATETGQFFVALEWAEGATLREVLDAGGPLAVATALRVAIRIGEALEALHHNRLVHGQLGPESVIMVNDGERIRLVGVELAAAYRTPIGLRLRDELSVAYRAPEQIERGETTAAADVYALGMLLRQLLTAGKASPAGSPFAAAPPLSPPIQRIITTALEARTVHRYPDVSVMVNDIWGAMAVLTEPESRPRSVKARGNPRRRVRQRRPVFTLRMTAASRAVSRHPPSQPFRSSVTPIRRPSLQRRHGPLANRRRRFARRCRSRTDWLRSRRNLLRNSVCRRSGVLGRFRGHFPRGRFFRNRRWRRPRWPSVRALPSNPGVRSSPRRPRSSAESRPGGPRQPSGRHKLNGPHKPNVQDRTRGTAVPRSTGY